MRRGHKIRPIQRSLTLRPSRAMRDLPRSGESRMYLTNLIALNVGPLADLELAPEFHDNGNPKPIVLVGGNGCGKTNVLSIIADALIEIAATKFSDITPHVGQGRQYYRMLGPLTVRQGADFELSALRFSHDGAAFGYRGVIGDANAQELAPRLMFMPEMANWGNKADKSVFGPTDQVENIFRSGAYAFLPSNRSEIPIWLNSGDKQDRKVSFSAAITDELKKPIVPTSTFDAMKSWMVDVILDQSMDSAAVIQLLANGAQGLQDLMQAALQAVQLSPTLGLMNQIISEIIKRPNSRFVRAGRSANERKIQIFQPDNTFIPTLDSLSAGQSSLLSIFGTLARYGDAGLGRPAQEISGIIVVDEIDAHLHADLQYEVLPKLISMFPKVQFIITSHSPLLALGLTKALGENGISLIELPTGNKINAERFNEFETSLSYFRATKSFEENISQIVSKSEKPLVICEGETDPVYVRTAAELLGFDELSARVTFDWVGQRGNKGAEGGGKDNLRSAYSMLKNNPKFLRSPTVTLFDGDAPQANEDIGDLHRRTLPRNPQNKLCRAGVEELLPEDVFEDRFYDVYEKRTAKIVITKDLKKVELCNHLCNEVRDPDHFRLFEPTLRMLCDLFNIAPPQQATP